MKCANTNLRLEPELKQKLEDLAKSQRRTLPDMIRIILENAVNPTTITYSSSQWQQIDLSSHGTTK